MAKCTTNVVLPTGDVKIQDGALSSGAENYKEFWYTMVGLAGEGQNFEPLAGTEGQSLYERKARQMRRIIEADFHRNGVCGEGFYVAVIKDDDSTRKLVTWFPEYADDGETLAPMQNRVAVLDLDLAWSGNVYMHNTIDGRHGGGNAWRGDLYANLAREIAAKVSRTMPSDGGPTSSSTLPSEPAHRRGHRVDRRGGRVVLYLGMVSPSCPDRQVRQVSQTGRHQGSSPWLALRDSPSMRERR